MNYFFSVVFVLLLAPFGAFAEGPGGGVASGDVAVPTAKPNLGPQQLEELASRLESSREKAAELLKQLTGTKDEAEKKRVQVDLDKVNAQIDDLRLSIEKVAAGSLERELLADQGSEGFDWKKELEEIFKPIVVELKQMTERPRRIERLRSDVAFYEDRIPVAQRAVDKLATLKDGGLSLALAKEVARVEDRWRSRLSDLENKLDVTSLELNELLAPKEEPVVDAWEALHDFLVGRGLSVVLAISAFTITLLLMRGVHRVFDRRISRSAVRRKRFANRLVTFVFSSLSVVFALLVTMIVLSIRGDWLLLGLLLLVLFAGILALRHSLPLYMKEARILLNIGPVREDERVIYNGLPWRVADIGVFTTLVNPLLKGGRLRLSIDEVAALHSRPMADGEAWFPTRESDYVLLEDNTFGRVLAQTPEYVQMGVAGSIQTYPAETFLAKNPRNLTTEGFGILVELGLDYRYQADITTKIRDQLERYIRGQLQQHPYGADLKDLIIEFNQAAASSLNIAVIGVFTGNGAPNYFALKRLLNRLSVDACNHYGWSIPFNQVTVHMETPVTLAAGSVMPNPGAA